MPRPRLMPRLASAPSIRLYPQPAFSVAIRTTSCAISDWVLGRPGRWRQGKVQFRATHSHCQRRRCGRSDDRIEVAQCLTPKRLRQRTQCPAFDVSEDNSRAAEAATQGPVLILQKLDSIRSDIALCYRRVYRNGNRSLRTVRARAMICEFAPHRLRRCRASVTSDLRRARIDQRSDHVVQ